jgi:hypothetical protein
VRAYRLEKGKSGITAKEVWKANGPTLTESSPVIAGDLLFGSSPLRQECFFCLDASTGKTQWESNDTRQSFGYTSIVRMGGVLLFLTNKGRLVVVKAIATGYEPIAEYQVSERPICAHPVFLGGRILIKDDSSLRCFRIEQDDK